ncbi:hypothetical protein Tco_0030886 [Tanacetum coccineum]
MFRHPIHHIQQEDTAYPLLDFTRNHEDTKIYTQYPESSYAVFKMRIKNILEYYIRGTHFKDSPIRHPLEGRSTLRPADILVFGWAGGKHACVDLTGVSPLVGLRDNGFVAGQAALKAESSKVAKHEKACLENQHVFIPFAFDTFGFLAPEAEEFLNRVQRVVQSNFSTPKTENFIFSRIGFAIQKGVAAQLVARLPAILL